MSKKASIVVLTPVRNEAWVLDAFLTCTSSWADYIILADQHSNDGTREIAQKYEKVILIDNPTDEWFEYICRTRLLEEAAKIPGDKILFGLDADEFLSEGFEKTESWQRIINSQKNEIFCFNWLNLFDNFYTAEYTKMHYEWAAHFDASIDFVEEYKARERHAVHCARVPCLETSRCSYINVDDFWVIHLAKLNHEKMRQKIDFYQVTLVDKDKDKVNPIGMYRSYNKFYPTNSITQLNNPLRICCKGKNIDYSYLVKTSDYGKHYIDEIKQIFNREGLEKFYKLCIWDNPYLKEAGFNPKIPIKYRILHNYLRKTQEKSEGKIINYIDKLLKRLYRF